MAKVIVMARERGLRAKIIVGGAVITEDYAKSISADAYAPDAAGAVKKVAQLLE
jgi:5-methyltetrahydrofolate--homocysteine methyltransferase